MKIEMLVGTPWDGKYYKVGAEVAAPQDIPEAVAQRWVNNRIAKILSYSPVAVTAGPEPDEIPTGQATGGVVNGPGLADLSGEPGVEVVETVADGAAPDATPETSAPTYAELKERAKELGVPGYAKMKADQLRESIAAMEADLAKLAEPQEPKEGENESPDNQNPPAGE